MAAAYALGRPKVAATLAGVAIAAALVPPLAVVGIALTNGHPLIALNASVLLGSNLVAIILGASIVFRLLGVAQAWSGQDRPQWAGRVTMVLSLAAVLLAAPLVLRMLETQRAGAEKPLSFAVSAAVREAVDEYVGRHDGVEVITQGRDGVEPEAGVTVVLSARTAQPEGFETELEDLVRKARGNRDCPVRIFLLQSAW
jgi:uncharacterized membrane protein